MEEKEINQDSNEKDKLKITKKSAIIVILCLVLLTSVLIKKIGIIFSEEDSNYKKESIQKVENDKLINQITGKYIVNKAGYIPVITYFEKDKIINYTFNEEFPIDDILDIKENKDIISYEVESKYYDEVIYHVSRVKILENNKIQYIYEDDSKSTEYELLNKKQVIEEINEIYKDENKKEMLFEDLEKWLDIKEEDVNKI